jgi:PAS domain S-box-containing protein
MAGSTGDITEQKELKEALHESEERYALAMEAVNESIYDWDVANNTIYYAPRLFELVGLTPEDLKAPEDWSNRIHPDDLPDYNAAVVAHFKGESERLRIEYRYRHADGTWHWARQHGLALRDENGRAYRLAGSTGDITEQKELMQALDEAQTKLTEAIEAISEGFALFDAEDRLVICNSRFRNFYPDVADIVQPGTPFADILRESIERGVLADAAGSPDDWINARLERHLDPGDPHEHQLNDGRWLRISERKTHDGGVVGIYTDISELKRRETDLADQRAILEVTLENMDQGITMVDENLDTIALNTKFLELLELPPEQFKAGFNMEQAFRYNAERGEYGEGDVEEQVRSRLELTRKFEAHHFERTRPDGIVIEVRGNPLPSGKGFVSTYTDITERKQREAELAEARDEAVAAHTQFIEAIETASEGFVLWDPEDRLVLCNSKYKEFFAAGAGDDVADLVVPGTTFEQIIRAALQRGMFPDVDEDEETGRHATRAPSQSPGADGAASGHRALAADQRAPHPRWRSRCRLHRHHRAQAARGRARRADRQGGRGARPGDAGNPGQERLPGQHEPRAAHAAQCRHRHHRDAPRGRRGPGPERLHRAARAYHRRRQASFAPDQRGPRPLQDRGRQGRAAPGGLRPRPVDSRSVHDQRAFGFEERQ